MASLARPARFPQLAKYELIEELGHGGMATVYLARDKRLGREVAVKVIHPHLRDSREVVLRFNTEARAVAKLRHPNIVEVYDVSDADDAEQYLVVELVRGTTLRKLLQQRRSAPPEVAAAIALDLLGALAHAHAHGVVHRDIKPENVLIEQRSDGPAPGVVVVKLTDFGIAKLLDAQGVTSTGQVLGSPAHMAPEQIEGGEVDARADVFGMGVLLYECMVGHLPFEGGNPAQVLRRVLEGVYPEAQREQPIVGGRWSALVDRALAHAPAARFADAGAMRAAIAAELERLAIADPPGELAAWLHDPEGHEQAHARRMIDKLVALGSEARKAGEPICAAADYNRALAHAPEDPQLLRLVAAVNRAEARARLLRRAGAALALMVGLGAVTFAVGKSLRALEPAAAPPPAPSGATAVVLPAPVVVPTFPPPSGEPSPGATAPPRQAPAAAPARENPARVVERTFTLDLHPPMGIKLSIDGDAPKTVSTGWVEHLDTKPHELTFSCDVCVNKPIHVPAGDRDESLPVTLSIKPATLIIDGDPRKTYQIVEDPQLTIRAGANSIPLASKFRSLTVRQLETGAAKAVHLEAGQPATASF